MIDSSSILVAPKFVDGGMILGIRRSLAAVLLLLLGLTGVLLVALSGTAGSVPRRDTTVITPSDGVVNDKPDVGMGYDSVGPISPAR